MNSLKLIFDLLDFSNDVLKEKETIDDGAGTPDLQLSLYLALAWILVSLIMIRGIKSSGKASYFLAIFPYLIMAVLFVRAVTLPGAVNGIVYLFMPQWRELLNPRVKYKSALVMNKNIYSIFLKCLTGLVRCCNSSILLISYLLRKHHNVVILQ